MSSVPVSRAISASRARSAFERPSREISSPSTAPISPRHTRDISSRNPSRCAADVPDRPRSRSITSDTAVALGWAPRDVEVIDRDLGLSGTSAAHREGFRELMSRVCLGEIGAVFGLEISRLGRSNADLARLAEMARLTGTLLIDSDGVYDLADFNDWLVLGLKSTMSQAELHVLAGRLQAAKRAAAERGRS